MYASHLLVHCWGSTGPPPRPPLPRPAGMGGAHGAVAVCVTQQAAPNQGQCSISPSPPPGLAPPAPRLLHGPLPRLRVAPGQAMGARLAKLSPTRGFCAELSTAMVIMVASQYGLPTSSSQCITGARALTQPSPTPRPPPTHPRPQTAGGGCEPALPLPRPLALGQGLGGQARGVVGVGGGPATWHGCGTGLGAGPVWARSGRETRVLAGQAVVSRWQCMLCGPGRQPQMLLHCTGLACTLRCMRCTFGLAQQARDHGQGCCTSCHKPKLMWAPPLHPPSAPPPRSPQHRHPHTGGIIGVGLAEGIGGVNWKFFARTFASWVSTLAVVGLATAALFAQVGGIGRPAGRLVHRHAGFACTVLQKHEPGSSLQL